MQLGGFVFDQLLPAIVETRCRVMQLLGCTPQIATYGFNAEEVVLRTARAAISLLEMNGDLPTQPIACESFTGGASSV